MKKELAYYKITPSVVPADVPTEVEIKGLEPSSSFKYGVKYIVDITPHTYPSRPFSDGYRLSDIVLNNERYELFADNGALKFKHLFKGEQKWRIHIFESELAANFVIGESAAACWEPYLNALSLGCMLEMYSVREDLYMLRPYKGDLHLHTTHSDGLESPAAVAANYRKAGYDFISMTDHHVYTAAKEVNAVLSKLKTEFVVYNGEEIHNDNMGNIHIVSFDSDYSVNELIMGEATRSDVLAEVNEIKNSKALEGCFDKTDIAWRTWVYRAIKKSGGFAIFPHPYWNICDMEHASPEAIEYTFKNRLMDAFEIYGGVSHSENNLQALLYYEMRERGYCYPIVASTDAHSTIDGAEYFKGAYTVVFAKDPHSVRAAIESGLSVGVLSDAPDKPTISGGLRLAKYADFLISNYFPIHDEFCCSSGVMMHKYICEDKKNARSACEGIEMQIKEFENEFFGVGRSE